ncbi:hypothetical protein B0O80DRAFT_422281 [Mortierella sp. GBAus27b]|nr:hypothetical protein B0O80DRAFT_422281 [Mortierella sp. GBAus27b]
MKVWAQCRTTWVHTPRTPAKGVRVETPVQEERLACVHVQDDLQNHQGLILAVMYAMAILCCFVDVTGTNFMAVFKNTIHLPIFGPSCVMFKVDTDEDHRVHRHVPWSFVFAEDTCRSIPDSCVKGIHVPL